MFKTHYFLIILLYFTVTYAAEVIDIYFTFMVEILY